MRGKYTNWDLIEDVFEHAKRPLRIKEIWDIAVELGLDKKTKTKGKTPWNTLSSMFRYSESVGTCKYVKEDGKWLPKNMKS